MSWVKRVLLALVLVIALAAIGFVIWGSTPMAPLPEAQAALQSDAQASVSTGRWYVFSPAGRQPTTGLIFYPGARVDPRAYAPAAHAIAGRGYLVVIVPMPLNLAVLGSGRATAVMAAYPAIQRWAVGGHSLGGAMAAAFVYSHPDVADGLALWAAYPAANNSLAGRKLKVASISGMEDGLATPAKIEASRPLLPADTRWTPIAGGNHAGFGWYGPQPGDGTATISRTSQQRQVVDATLALLASLEE